jgi:hypothetical protein
MMRVSYNLTNLLGSIFALDATMLKLLVRVCYPLSLVRFDELVSTIVYKGYLFFFKRPTSNLNCLSSHSIALQL